MPGKARPADWDRFFGPHPRRRRGPVYTIALALLSGLLVSTLLFVGRGVTSAFRKSQVSLAQTATVAWGTAYADQTSKTASRTAIAAPRPTSTAVLPLARLTTDGNLRFEPRAVAGNIQGILQMGDEVAILSDATPGWFQVQVRRTQSTLQVGTKGWLAATLLVRVTPQAVPPTATMVARPTPGASPTR